MTDLFMILFHPFSYTESHLIFYFFPATLTFCVFSSDRVQFWHYFFVLWGFKDHLIFIELVYILFFRAFHGQVQAVFFIFGFREPISLLELWLLMYCTWSSLQCGKKYKGLNMPLNIFHIFRINCQFDMSKYCQLNFKHQDSLR